MYTNKTIRRALRSYSGRLGAERLEEPPDGLSPGLLSKRPFPPDFSAFRNRLPPGLGTQTGNTLWLEKERSWGWFFFLPFLYNIMTPI